LKIERGAEAPIEGRPPEAAFELLREKHAKQERDNEDSLNGNQPGVNDLQVVVEVVSRTTQVFLVAFFFIVDVVVI
jgi:hypothetical protein